MIAMYSSRKTPGFICDVVRAIDYPEKTTYTRSEHEPPEQYLENIDQHKNDKDRDPYSMTIHKCDPLRNDPWYLLQVEFC